MRWLFRWLRKRSQSRKVTLNRSTFRPEVESFEERVVPTVRYFGGDIMPHVEVQALYYGTGWSTPPAAATPTAIDTYLSNLVTSPFVDALTRAGYAVGQGSSSPGYVDTTAPIPVSGVLTEQMIEQEIQAQISGATPHLQVPDPNRLYVVFVQPGTQIQLGTDTSSTTILGYHDSYYNRSLKMNIRFAVVAYPGSPNITISNPPATPVVNAAFDDLSVVTSHELAEAVTDPDGRGWFDRRNGEIGDITAGTYATLSVTGNNSYSYLVQAIAGTNGQPLSLTEPPLTLTVAATAVAGTATWYGQQYTFTVTLTPPANQATPTGTITFLDGTRIIGKVNLPAGQTSVSFTANLGAGSHDITAIYNGDSNYQSAYSNDISEVVTPTTPPAHTGHGRWWGWWAGRSGWRR